MVDQRSWLHVLSVISRGCVWEIASIAAEVEWVGGQTVSAQTIRRTLNQIGLHGCRPRRKPLLKMMHKKARKQFAKDKQTKDIDYWNHVLCSDETKIIYLVQMVSSVCGGNQVSSTKTSVSCLQSSMVVGVSWSGAAWVLPALQSYSSLREPWMPTCTVTEAEHDPLPSETGPQGSIPTW